MIRQKKILLLESKNLCYFSSHYFMEQMQRCFLKFGMEVERYDLTEEYETILEDVLERREEFRVVIDINSLLPRMELEDGTPYLKKLGVPFFNYLVDHPMYHHLALCTEIPDYYVFCVDPFHAAYIQKYYPHIKDAFYLPLGAMEQTGSWNRISFQEKKYPFLFIGTYYSLDEAKRQMEGLNTSLQEEIETLIHLQLSEQKPQEQLVREYLEQKDMELSDEKFAGHMNLVCYADLLVRHYKRQEMIRWMAKSGLPVTVIGNGWEKLKLKSQGNLTFLDEVSFPLSANMIASAKILWNVSTEFFGAYHDRVHTALYQKTLPFTEALYQPSLEEKIEEYVEHYDFRYPKECIRKAWWLYENMDYVEEKTITAATFAKERLGWESRCQQILEIFGKIEI